MTTNNMQEVYKAIAQLMTDVAPKVAATKGADDVMIETRPLLTHQGQLVARTFGPYPSVEAAENVLRLKRDRHRSHCETHFANGGAVENDKHVWGHPQLEFRVIPSDGYFSRYLAQIMMTAMGGVVSIVTQGTESLTWQLPDDTIGLEESDIADEEETHE